MIKLRFGSGSQVQAAELIPDGEGGLRVRMGSGKRTMREQHLPASLIEGTVEDALERKLQDLVSDGFFVEEDARVQAPERIDLTKSLEPEHEANLQEELIALGMPADEAAFWSIQEGRVWSLAGAYLTVSTRAGNRVLTARCVGRHGWRAAVLFGWLFGRDIGGADGETKAVDFKDVADRIVPFRELTVDQLGRLYDNGALPRPLKVGTVNAYTGRRIQIGI